MNFDGARSASFTVTRVYSAQPRTLFDIIMTPDLRRQWLYDLDGVELIELEQDLRAGGVERVRLSFGAGPILSEHRFEKVEAPGLIRLTRTMTVDDRVSTVSTREFRFHPVEGGAEGVYTEELQMFDPADTADRNRDTVIWYLRRLGAIAAGIEAGGRRALAG